jgi:hypothetical protein
MYISLHVKYPLFLSVFMKLEHSQQIFDTCSSIKFHEPPLSGRRVVPYGRKDGQTDGEADRMKLMVTFRNFANAPEMSTHSCVWSLYPREAFAARIG